MRDVTCVGCGTVFQAKSPLAKWCGAKCRKRVERSGKSSDAESAKTPRSVIESHGLVRAVRLELEAADRLDTVFGQIALELARRLADPEEAGPSALAKEMRASLALAVGEGGGSPAEPDDDEVARARKVREEARQAAGRA